MTDKQIIIDGVDVSGCEFFGILRPCGCLGWYRCNCDSISTESLNCEENNCIYKQLKRKEQECEELKLLNNRLNSALGYRRAGKKTFTDLSVELDQLKAENEELKKQNKRLDEVATHWHKSIFKVERSERKLKQTLTEIKEIAMGIMDDDSEESSAYYDAKRILQKISEVEDV